MSFKHIIYAYCAGKAVIPFYYIVVLIQLTLFTPWLVKLKNRRWLYLITPIYLIALYIINIKTGKVPILYETVFPAWFGFYIFGMDCKAGKWDNVIVSVQKYWIAAALIGSVAEAYIILKLGGAIGFALSQIRMGSFLYTITLILFLMKRYKESNTYNLTQSGKLLASIGDCSYGIFYVHMLILMPVQKLVCLMGLTKIWILNFFLCFLLTAVGSYFIVKFVGKIADRKNMGMFLRIIGF